MWQKTNFYLFSWVNRRERWRPSPSINLNDVAARRAAKTRYQISTRGNLDEGPHGAPGQPLRRSICASEHKPVAAAATARASLGREHRI